MRYETHNPWDQDNDDIKNEHHGCGASAACRNEHDKLSSADAHNAIYKHTDTLICGY
jgi:hypothetical protein